MTLGGFVLSSEMLWVSVSIQILTNDFWPHHCPLVPPFSHPWSAFYVMALFLALGAREETSALDHSCQLPCICVWEAHESGLAPWEVRDPWKTQSGNPRWSPLGPASTVITVTERSGSLLLETNLGFLGILGRAGMTLLTPTFLSPARPYMFLLCLL